MRKITLFLLSLVCSVTALQAQNSLLVSETLPGTLTDGQYHWTSTKLTAPEGEFKKLRVTFLQNSNGEQPAGFPCITIAEFYLYDNNGNLVELTEDKFSSNATQSNEGKIAALCNGHTTKQEGEGDYDWYWHSQWSGTPSPYGYHYLEIDLDGIEADLTQYSIGWVTRRSQASPAEIIISAGASSEDACINANSCLLPEISKGNNPIVYTIRSVRSKKYLAYTNNNEKPTQKDNAEANSFWYFTEGTDGKIIIHNLSTSQVLGNKVDEECKMAESGEWYIKPSIYRAGLTIAQNANGIKNCIDDQSGSIGLWDHNPNDNEGTTWLIVKANNSCIPFKFTTDNNAPILYSIKSGRTNDGKEWYYTYDADDAKIALTQFNGEETQYWYFKTAANNGHLRVQIYPYAGEGKAMSYNSTGNAPGNVEAKAVGENGYTQQWTFVATDGKAPYGMKTNGGENYLSNNGGVNNKMGMWNDTPKNDGGSAMYFYSLSDMVTAKIVELQGAIDNLGTDVGQFANALEGIEDAITAAKEAKTSKELIAAYKNLVAIDLTVNMPIAEKFYTIKNYNEGKYMNVSDGAGATVYSDAALNELFQFVPATDGKFYLYNVKRAKYLSNAPGHGGGQVLFAADNISDAKTVKVAHLGVANQMSITPDGGATIHHDTNYSKVVGWNTGANDKSAWFIEEVANPAEYVHGMNLETGWATLCLGCDVTIPEGVEAYTVKEIVENSAVLEQVAGVIPAKCSVIIKAEAGEYSFAYSATKGVANETNLLVGTTVNANISKESYVLDNSTEPSFIKAVYNVNTDTTNDGTEEEPNVTYEAYLNNAFCAYLPKADDMTADYYTLSIHEDDETTAIENVEMINEKEEIFDITGRKVNAITTRGIYIINGNKVIK